MKGRQKIMRKLIAVFIAIALIPILTSCRPAGSRTVVVYVSEDQVFSEPILKDFERETGITV
jgi:iron(III) transport system substrate-binding protein